MPNEANAARHDILEVNQYFISGLTGSTIDVWFTGSVPSFTATELNIPELKGVTLSEAISRTREGVKKLEKGPVVRTVRFVV